MLLKVEDSGDPRARVYAAPPQLVDGARSSRPSSAQPVASSFDVQLERPPHSVPPFRPSNAATTRVLYTSQAGPSLQNVVYEGPITMQGADGQRYAVHPPGGPRVRDFLAARNARPPAPSSTPPANNPEIVVVSEEEVQKCSRFLKSLVIRVLRDRQKYTPETAESVRELVKAVVRDELPPHDFTEQLAVLLGTKPQPQLEPFLAKNLPALRAGLRSGRYALDLDDPPAVEPAPPPQIVYASMPQQIVGEAAQMEQQVYILPSTGSITISTADGHPITTPAVYVDVPPATELPPDAPMEDVLPVEEEAAEQSEEAEVSVPPMPALPFTILDSSVLWNRLAAEVPGCEGIEAAVVSRMAEVIEWRLGELLSDLSATAAHRIEPLRLNPHFEQVSDPRRQLRFVEQMEKAAHERQAAIEKDALLKAAAKGGKSKDSSEKAKEIKRVNQEDAANRDANEAAIAALGGRGTKRPFAPPDPLRNASTSGLHVATHRPRICRVTLRDLQFVLNCSPTPSTSTLKFQVAYGQIRLPNQHSYDF